MIRRVSVVDEVFKILHEWILSGRLKHGDKLPSQDKLAAEFGVSRSTVREAIHKLTVMGLVTPKQGLGTVVNIATASSYMISLKDHLLLKPATVQEFLEARIFIEKATVRLAATRATSGDVAVLKALLDRQAAAVEKKDRETFSKLDVEFHMEMADISKNTVLMRFLETIWDLLHEFIAEVSQLPGSIENAVRFHKEIADCIIGRNPEGAEKKIIEHLYDVVRTIEKHMKVDLNADSIFKLAESASEK